MSDTGSPLLKLRNVSRVFPVTDTVAVRNVSLTVGHGESVALLGRSGSGKSTLLNILGVLDTATSGQYLFGDENVTALNGPGATQFRRDNIGFVFQSYHLIPSLTAIENVALGVTYRGVPKHQALAHADALLGSVGLGHRSWHRCRTMSGGEQQRVAIARALIGEPRLLLADEPTGNLDSSNGELVMNLLLRAVEERGIALVLVTHDDEVADQLGSAVVMHDGVIESMDRYRALTRAPSSPTDASATTAHGHDRRAPERRRFSSALVPLREAMMMLRSRKRYLWFTAAAVALAVGMTVASTGLNQSASAQVSGLFDARRAREVLLDVAADGRAGADTAEGRAGPPTSLLHGLRLDLLQRTAGVEHAGGFELWNHVPAETSGAATEAAVVMVSPGALRAARSHITWAKRPHAVLSGEVILSEPLAERLKVASLDRSPEVTIDGRLFRVVGILHRSSQPQLGGAAIIGEAVGGRQADSAWIAAVTVPGAAEQVSEQAPLILDPYEPGRMKAAAVQRADGFRVQLEAGVSGGLAAMTGVTALAALAGIGCVMVLGLTSRTPEFGLRRALGASRSAITAQVAGEAAIGGALGGVVGLGLGFAAVLCVTIAAHWRPVFDTRIALAALAAGLAIGMLAGIVPALLASRIHPSEALRST